MRNYSFVIPGLLAGCAAPSTDEEAEWIAAHHQTVVDLREGAHAQYPESFTAKLRSAGVCMINIPVEDFAAPSADQMLHFCGLVEQAALSSSSVLVHCRAGIGRTGTMLAATISFILLRLASTSLGRRLHGDVEQWRGSPLSAAVNCEGAVVIARVVFDYLRALRPAFDVIDQYQAFERFVRLLLAGQVERRDKTPRGGTLVASGSFLCC